MNPEHDHLAGYASAPKTTTEDYRKALEKILATKPQIVMDGDAPVGSGDAFGWNVHMIARAALAALDAAEVAP